MLKFNFNCSHLERKLRTGNYESHFIFENVLLSQADYIQKMVSFYCKEKQLKPFVSTPMRLCSDYSELLPSDFYEKVFCYDLLVLSEIEKIEITDIVRDVVAEYLADNKVVVLISTNSFDKKAIIPKRFLNEIIIC